MFLSALLIPEFSDHQDCSAGCGAQHVAQIVGEAPSLAHDHKNLQWFALAQIISWLHGIMINADKKGSDGSQPVISTMKEIYI